MHSLGHPPKLLLVDDDVGLLRLMQSTFQREGCVTDLVTSGAEAVEWLQNHHADLFLLDLKLRDMTGGEVLERLEQTGRVAPFIIITGQGDERVAVEMMKRGALDYMVKDGGFLDVLPAVVNRAIRQISQQYRLTEAEAAVEASQALAQSVLNSLPARIAVLNASGVILATNKPWKTFAGEKFGPRIFHMDTGTDFLSLCKGESASGSEGDIQMLSALESVMSGGPSATVEFSHGANEDERWYGCSISPMTAEAKGVVVSHFDVSERKALEAEVLQIAERERERVAADLHDGICQELTGISFNASALERKLLARKSPFVSEVRKIVSELNRAAAHTRQVARGLSPVVNDGLGLVHALRALARTTESIHRLSCHFECETEVEISDPVVANQLFRVAQEAVANAVRHARAADISVRLERSADVLRLRIEDDGRGMQMKESASGIGLRAMRYRSHLIGGNLRIEPREGGGTTIVCELSCPNKPCSS